MLFGYLSISFFAADDDNDNDNDDDEKIEGLFIWILLPFLASFVRKVLGFGTSHIDLKLNNKQVYLNLLNCL